MLITRRREAGHQEVGGWTLGGRGIGRLGGVGGARHHFEGVGTIRIISPKSEY